MDATKPTPKMPRWLRWVLVLSLAFNLMVVGIVGGWILTGGKHARHHPSRLEQIGGPLTRALSHKDRYAIGREVRQLYRDKQDGRAAQIALMETLIDDLRADPFDREAVAAHMAGQREFLNDRLSLGQTLLIERLESMDGADRAAYADRLAEGLKHRRNKK